MIMFWTVVLGLTCIKILLIPSYFSTDFEVHRNWLAITYSLPINKWYVDDSSEWTLDYPPFFAWFEYILSQVAHYFDPKMIEVKNLNYKSEYAILFQRLSVIISDFVFAYGVKECGKYLSNNKLRKCSKWKSQWNSPSAIVTVLLLCNATLLLIDHIHFQYNGFLFGILLLSMIRMLQNRFAESTILFSILLNLKHIFIYIAPAYFVYLLRNFCFMGKEASFKNFSFKKFSQLAAIVIFITFLSFGPFIWHGQFLQVLSRLFPFKRGLTHSYWAPNIWALYNAIDRVLFFIGRKFKFDVKGNVAAMSGGLVQQYEHSVLPTITPLCTFIITICAMTPGLLKLWLNPGNPLHFVRCLIICAFSSFIFGWHVHEKAILLPIIPLTFMSVIWRQEAVIFLILSTIGEYALFPLLFKPFELPIKVTVALMYSIYAFHNLSHLHNVRKSKFTFSLLNQIETLYIISLLPLFLYEHVFQYFLSWHSKWTFLPLMMTSVHNAVGVIYGYLIYYKYFLKLEHINHKRKAY